MRAFFVRSVFAIIYAVVLLSSTYYSKHSYYALFFVMMLFCIKEFKKLIKFTNNWIYVLAVLVYLSFTNYISSYLMYVFAAISIIIPFALYFINNKITKKDLSNFLLSIVYVVLPFGLLIRIPFVQGTYNPTIIIASFVLIWANDSFAYLVGKSIGKHKLMESVSPNKTIEGFIGGLVATNMAGYIISIYFPSELNMIQWLILANICAILAVLGDLLESKFKRLAKVKDSANTIPGHGGFLDRLDSLILVAPFVYLFLQFV